MKENSRSLYVLRYGVDEPLPEQTKVRAGPLSLVFEAGDLRYIRYGDHELIRRVYVAVRDQNWNTIAPQIENLEIAAGENEFRITFDVRHLEGEIGFDWRATIVGEPDGTIRFDMVGQALTTFLRNRIGFCVLHPESCAGLPCRIEHVDGAVEKATFPAYISPHQPFVDMRAITHEVIPGLEAAVRLAGDIFEMEDQRNWTDASFKTYSTPLAVPFPVRVNAGDRIDQSVTVRLRGSPNGKLMRRAETEASLSLMLIDGPAAALPALGLGVASHGQMLERGELERLQGLNLRHLRVDLRLDKSDTATRLRQAWSEARAIGADLEVALFLAEAPQAELTDFCAVLAEIRPVVCRWLIFHRTEKSTDKRWIDAARLLLGGAASVSTYKQAAPIGGGTNAYFTELNRERPPLSVLDFLTYSISPQVHAFDNLSLVETLAAQGATVRSAAAFGDGLPVHISPVTLRPRFNPNATGPEPEPAAGELPAEVDPRQMSLFCAAWTAGSIKYLAENGVQAATYFETTGWRGVMERSAGSPLPGPFRSFAGGVFPVYHLFADMGEFIGATVLPSKSSDDLRMQGLVLETGDARSVWLANLSPQRQTVVLEGIIAAHSLRLLDETNVVEAIRDPQTYRVNAPVRTTGPLSSVELLPYGLVRIDGRAPKSDGR